MTTAIRLVLAAAAILAAVDGAYAQRATVTPSSARADETSNLTFHVGARWTYDAEVEFYTEDLTATEGEDYQGFANPFSVCVTGRDVHGMSPGCNWDGTVVAAGETEEAVIVHYRDEIDESNERYRVVARVVRYETGRLDAHGVPEVRECPNGCGRATATGTIIDGDEDAPAALEPPPEGTVRFDSGNRTVTEGESLSLTVRFKPTETPHGRASVRWSTESDSDSNAATSGTDYVRGSGTLRFDACSSTTTCPEQTRTITVRTREDRADEHDELVFVRLSNFDNVASRDPWTPITIRNKAPAPGHQTTPTLTMSGDSVNEGATARVTITLSARGPSGARVKYRVGNPDERSGDGDCRDYRYRTGTLNLAGRTSATLAVPILTDGCREQGESVAVTLHEPERISLGQNAAQINIADIFSVLRFETTDDRAIEAGELREAFEGRSAEVRVYRDTYRESGTAAQEQHDRAHRAAVSARLTTADGTAVAGDDYTALDTTVRLAAGQTRATVWVRALNDTGPDDADEETFSVTLSEPVGAVFDSRYGHTGCRQSLGQRFDCRHRRRRPGVDHRRAAGQRRRKDLLRLQLPQGKRIPPGPGAATVVGNAERQ